MKIEQKALSKIQEVIKFVGKIKRICKALKKREESAIWVYYISFVYTFVLLVLFVLEALAEYGIIKYNWRTPFELVSVYCTLLSAYIFNKELLDRWISHLIWKQKPGEFLVLLWGLSLLVFFIGEFFSGGEFHPPAYIILVFEFVLAGFIGTAVSKTAYYRRYPYRKIRLRDNNEPTQEYKTTLVRA